MGVKLIILLALILGVLYTIHLLIKDYQAITGPKLLRLLFKRDLHSTLKDNSKPYVRWKRILQHDVAMCARALFCGLARRPPASDLHAGLLYMLTVPPREEEAASFEAFKEAAELGARTNKTGDETACWRAFPRCPFAAETLLDLGQYVLDHPVF